MLTFEDARQIVDREYRPAYHLPGTFTVAPYGMEDDLLFYVLAGAEEWLTGRDWRFRTIDDEIIFVSRATGEVISTTFLEAGPHLDQMDKVGDWPDE